MRQTCTDHCSKCGQHFHGLHAFDAHLRRVNEGTNYLGARSYDLDHVVGSTVGLQPWTTTSHCDFTGQTEVTVWQRIPGAGDAARLAKLAANPASSDGPSDGRPEKGSSLA
jgi:hypothetical protein